MINPEIVAQFKEFSVGPLMFHGYGLIIGVAVVTSLILFIKYAPSRITQRSSFYLLVLYTVTSAIAAGRLLFITFQFENYVDKPLSIFYLWDGGITIFGVLLGGIIGYSVYWWRYVKDKPRSYQYFLFPDYAVPFVALGQAIGRWGNFLNQELYGYPTSRPWGMYISPANRIENYSQYETFHPSFLYESILSLLAFAFLFTILQRIDKKKLGKGILFGLYLSLYGIIRLVLERIRIDSEPFLWEAKLADIASIFLIIIGSLLILHGTRKLPKKKKQH